MKRSILCLLLTALPAPTVLADWREHCATTASLAETIMQGRQAGVAMAKMIEVSTGDLGREAEPLIIAAYEQPRYSTEPMKQRAIEEFRDAAYLHCAKARRSGSAN